MLNAVWGLMIIIGIVFAAFCGRLDTLTNAALSSAKDAVTLCITMIGVMSVWVGLMEVAQGAGLVAKLTKGISPLVSFLFPTVPKNHKAREHISTNFIANLLGLGWAATPAGILAMKELDKLNPDKGTATSAMCTFLILNISSLQLIPVSIIAYRSQYGSVNPAGVIIPGFIATAVSTLVGIVFAKLAERK